jgi:exodeoxyribonuclease V beta subunit
VVWGRFRDCERSALGYVLHQQAGAGADVAKAVSERIGSMSDVEMLADLHELAALLPDSVEVAMLSPDSRPPYRDEARTDPEKLSARARRRRETEPWRVSSFSALVAAPHDLSAAAEEGLDRDELAAQEAGEVQESGVAERQIRLAELPTGARIGLMIHKILELVDFRDPGGEEQHRVAERSVADYGLERRWVGVVHDAVRDLVETPLPVADATFRLCDVARQRRIDEMEFVFPIGDRRGGRLDPASLADAFARHAAPRHDPAYAEQIRGLDFGEFSGFLRGYVDLVFEHGGRWYLVDYKSNFLGTDASDYRIDRLCRQMASSHYYLQYHLYTVALHRHLAQRLSGYEYESHFGGVLYLFVRGMAPEDPHSRGIFYDRPSAALVEDLSATLSIAERAASGQ